MKGIRWRRLEAETLIEVPRLLGQRVRDKRPHTDGLRSGRTAQQGVLEQGPAESATSRSARVLVQHRCYTKSVPTKRRRHAITETPPVQEALDELRRELRTDRVELPELVILGAREKLARIRTEGERTLELRRRLAERVRSRELPVETDAADEVRRSGWARK